jgi:hypothetical protein
LGDLDRAIAMLRSFIGKTVLEIKSDQFHMELVFGDGSRFRTQCSWRITREDLILLGSGDMEGQISKDPLLALVGLKDLSGYDVEIRRHSDPVRTQFLGRDYCRR